MKRRDYNVVMLPTSEKGRGRHVRYRFHSLYPGPTVVCISDPLAVREAAQQYGWRMRPAELKLRIKRSLGFKALGMNRPTQPTPRLGGAG